jgi:S-adenosylmethionine hydrolase
MILLLTDFTLRGPYVGEMLAVLAREAPGLPSLSLMSDLPPWSPRAAAYLVDALRARQPAGSVLVVVVDPGVGTRSRRPVWLEAQGQILVGPDNGLFEVVLRRAPPVRMHEILWRPRRLSASFHGRDLFAPVAARLATGVAVAGRRIRRRGRWSGGWPEDLDEVIYVDGFGNCMTGRRACTMPRDARISVDGRPLAHARTFGAVAPGEAFWYENSLGLVELSVNQGRADAVLGLAVGTAVRVVTRSPRSGRRRLSP